MTHNSEIFAIRIPKNTRKQLQIAAQNHNMTTPEFVRAVLGLIARDKLSLTIIFQQEQKNNPLALEIDRTKTI